MCCGATGGGWIGSGYDFELEKEYGADIIGIGLGVAKRGRFCVLNGCLLDPNSYEVVN